MKFTNIKLADGKSGARSGQGLKRAGEHYVTGSHYGFGTVAGADVNEDYYVIWNNWPTFTGVTADTTINITGLTALTNIGITNLFCKSKPTHVVDTSLDCAIVRKSDRKAVRITITGTDHTHYRTNWTTGTAVVAAIDPDDGPWSPEIGRLVNMGYIG